MISLIQQRLKDSADLKHQLAQDLNFCNSIQKIANQMVSTFKNNGKVLWCGNGGSAADAQHLAAELSGRYYTDRPPLNSEALHVNTSYLTAVANDYGYSKVYSRLIEAFGHAGDILIGLSTSGNSSNVVEAFKTARHKKLCTIAFTGAGGGALHSLSDFCICIPSTDTPRIQECHMLIGHSLCEFVEQQLFPA
jgi:D-sedoheptulose 7-phosphate isomerase